MRLKTREGLVPSSLFPVPFVFRGVDCKCRAFPRRWSHGRSPAHATPLPGVSHRAVRGPPAPHTESVKRVGPGAPSCPQATRGGLCGGGRGPGPTPQLFSSTLESADPRIFPEVSRRLDGLLLRVGGSSASGALGIQSGGRSPEDRASPDAARFEPSRHADAAARVSAEGARLTAQRHLKGQRTRCRIYFRCSLGFLV